MLHVTEVIWKNALQDAELGLIDWLTFIAVQDFPQVFLLAFVDFERAAAGTLLCKDAINIAVL